MTADWFSFDSGFLRNVSTRITNEVDGVSRVLYDSELSFKPYNLVSDKLQSYKQTAWYHRNGIVRASIVSENNRKIWRRKVLSMFLALCYSRLHRQDPPSHWFFYSALNQRLGISLHSQSNLVMEKLLAQYPTAKNKRRIRE